MQLRNPWGGLRGLPLDVWVIAGTTLVNRMGTMVVPFLVLYLTGQLGFAVATAGLVLSVYGVGSLVSGPIAGRLCDRVGALRVMQGSLLLSGLLFLLFPLVHGVAAVLGLTFVLAVIGEAVRPASLAALTGGATPEQRKAAFALTRLAINLGMSVGPAVGGFLAMVSFPLLFVVDGATSLAAALAMTLVLRRARAPEAEAPAPAPAAAPVAAVGGVLADRRMWLLLSAFFLVGVVFFQHEGAMPLFLVRDLRLPTSVYGMLFVVNTLLIVALEVPLNLSMAHWPHRRALTLGALLIAAGFGATALAAGPLGLAMTVVVWTFGEMILFPAAATYVADIAPPARRGEYMGAYSMAWGLAFTVGPWAGTTLLASQGATALWSAVFVVGLAGAAVLSALAEPEPEPAAAALPAV